MATIKEIKDLALHAARGTVPSTEYSVIDVNDSLREEMNSLCKTYRDFQRNKNDIFQIIEETADEVIPNRVMNSLGMFAEIRQVNNGEKVVFKNKVGKTRAKKFLTQVGLSGVYETFRLDTASFEIKPQAVGGAGILDFEGLLSGDDSMGDYMDIIVDGIEDATYKEVQKCLRAALNSSKRPTANKVTVSSYDAAKLQALCATVKAYGQGATIFAPPEFIVAMGPDLIGGSGTNAYSANDIEDIRTGGRVRLFRGNVITEIPQSFTDETNTKTAIDPQLAYVLPTGGEKVVKVAFEGNTEIHEFENRDNSMELQAYKKIGVGITTQYNWGIYQNTGITQTYDA